MKNAKTAARKSHILKVVSSSLTGCCSRKTFPSLFIEFWNIKKRKKITSKIYNKLTKIELVLNALVDYIFYVFFSCFSITHNSIKSKRKFFSWTVTCEAQAHDLFIPCLARLLDARKILKIVFFLKVTTFTSVLNASVDYRFAWSFCFNFF